jgi:S-(hydroxymethyl)glutathione dehydrogenase / alcohol dehydrogenase
MLSSGYHVEGSTVVVFGCGCIGLSCVNVANLVGALCVIAINTNPSKELWACKFGATNFINPQQLPKGKCIQDHLVELMDGGLDFTFDVMGNVSSHENEGVCLTCSHIFAHQHTGGCHVHHT